MSSILKCLGILAHSANQRVNCRASRCELQAQMAEYQCACCKVPCASCESNFELEDLNEAWRHKRMVEVSGKRGSEAVFGMLWWFSV